MSTWRRSARPFDEARLRAFVREALSSGLVREVPHSRIGRAHRKISNRDIIHALEYEHWKLDREPLFDAGRERWRYRIRSEDIEGDELILVISPRVEKCLLEIVTKF